MFIIISGQTQSPFTRLYLFIYTTLYNSTYVLQKRLNIKKLPYNHINNFNYTLSYFPSLYRDF